MDKASDFGSGDCQFESGLDYVHLFFKSGPEKMTGISKHFMYSPLQIVLNIFKIFSRNQNSAMYWSQDWAHLRPESTVPCSHTPTDHSKTFSRFPHNFFRCTGAQNEICQHLVSVGNFLHIFCIVAFAQLRTEDRHYVGWNEPCDVKTTNVLSGKKGSKQKNVLPESWIEHETFPLRRERSTTKLHRLSHLSGNASIFIPGKKKFQAVKKSIDRWLPVNSFLGQ